MPTPLETFILDSIYNSHIEFWVDNGRIAVGTDKTGYSPLLDGVKWVSSTCARVYDDDEEPDESGISSVRLPLCYAYHLHLTDADWSEAGNLRWVRDVVTGLYPPHVCHVFHAKAAEALRTLGQDCSLGTFHSAYRGLRGPENTTFKELEIILGAGYTQVVDLRRRGHVVLNRR